MKRPTFKEFLKKILKDPEVHAEYKRLKPEFKELIKKIKGRLQKTIGPRRLGM